MKLWTKSFVSKLILSFVLLSVVSLCGVGTIAYLEARSSMVELVLEQLQTSADLKEDALNRWLETHRKATISLGLLSEVKTQAEILLTASESGEEWGAAYRQMQSLMSVAFASHSDVSEILIIAQNDGKIIFSTNPKYRGESRIGDEYFREGLHKTYVQSVYLSPLTDQPTVTISTPLSGKNNQILGVLAVNLNLETAAEILAETNRNPQEKTYWVNRFRVPISHTSLHPEKLPRRLESPGLEAALNRKNGTHQSLNYAGEPVIGVHRWLEEWNSVLLVEQSRSQALQPVRQLAANLLFIGSTFLLIIPFIIYKLVRHLTQPILTVTAAATQIAVGNLKRVPVTSADELGILAAALNRIAKQLHSPDGNRRENTQTFKKPQTNPPETPTEIEEKPPVFDAKIPAENHQERAANRPLNSRQLHQFLEAIPVGVVVLDAGGNIYYSNRVAQSLFGSGAVPDAPADAEIYPSYVVGTGEMYAARDLPLVRALRGETVTIDDIEVHQNDKIVPIKAWGTPIYDEGGNIAFAIAAFEDISERKNAEAERQEFIEDMFRMNCDLQLALDQEEQVNSAAERFVPHQFLTCLSYESIVEVKNGDAIQQEMSILFSDIRNFTQLSERMNPADNFKFINAYLARMEPAISKNCGFIDKYIGDGIMALFGGSADRAVQAGIDMLRELNEYNRTRARSDRSPIQIGIGINTGDLMLGIVGGQDRMDTTVIGDAVNLAARLERLTKEYNVPLLISENTFLRLPDPTAYSLRLIDRALVCGKSNKVSIFEIFDADLPEIRDKKLQTKTKFELAITHYYRGEYQQAAQLFSECLAAHPPDPVTQMFWQKAMNKI